MWKSLARVVNAFWVHKVFININSQNQAWNMFLKTQPTCNTVFFLQIVRFLTDFFHFNWQTSGKLVLYTSLKLVVIYVKF